LQVSIKLNSTFYNLKFILILTIWKCYWNRSSWAASRIFLELWRNSTSRRALSETSSWMWVLTKYNRLLSTINYKEEYHFFTNGSLQ
jgi:hypothetical protein